MTAVVVTGELPHHKYLCVELTKAHQVVGIIHPQKKADKSASSISRLARRFKTYGVVHTILSLMTRLPSGLCGWESRAECRSVESAFFPSAAAEYETLDRRIVYRGIDVRSKSAIELMKGLRPDVVVCLGGPVYPKGFIESANLMLNFHSGLSPLYNGAASAQFAFSNGHPHLCGGTLMRMTPVIDGGGILGHYLPEIDETDNPATLLMKTVRAAPLMYDRIMSHFEQEGPVFSSVAQPRPLFYYRGSDWTVCHTQRIRRHLRMKLTGKFVRAERAIEYWRNSGDEAAKGVFDTTIAQLLWSTL